MSRSPIFLSDRYICTRVCVQSLLRTSVSNGVNLGEMVSPSLIGSSLCLLVFSAITVILRLVSRHVRRKPLRSHDYLVFLSLLCLTAYAINCIIGTISGGYGVHLLKLEPERILIALKVFFANEYFFLTGIGAFRLAILEFHVELFQGHDTFYWVARATEFLVILYWIATILTVSLLCQPVQYNWNREIAGSCGDLVKAAYASCGFNMIIDLGVVMLPLPIIWRLHISNRKKLDITACFAGGIITFGINLGRMIQTKVCPPEDVTYCVCDSSILVMAELAAGILVACIPALGPVLFRRRRGESPPAAYDRHFNPPSIGTARVRPLNLSSFSRIGEEETEARCDTMARVWKE